MHTMKKAALALVASVAGFGGLVEAQAQSVGYGTATGSRDIGSRVYVREVGSNGVYEGTWTQRGRSNVYDGVWVYLPTGERITDVLQVQGVVDGQLVITRPGGVYAIPAYRNGAFGRGKASWVTDPNYYWEILERR